MASPSSRQVRSVRRPILAVSLTLTLLVSVAGSLLARNSRETISETALAEARQVALTGVRRRARTDARQAAESLHGILEQAPRVAGAIADALYETARAPSAALAPGYEPTSDTRPGEQTVWTLSRESGAYAVAATNDPNVLAALGREAERLEPLLEDEFDFAGVIAHVAVWLPGKGVIGLPAPESGVTSRAHDVEEILGLLPLEEGGLDEPRWLQPATRIVHEEVVTYALPLYDPAGVLYGVIAADISFAQLQEAVAVAGDFESGSRAVLWSPHGEILTAAPGTAEMLGVARTGTRSEPFVAEALREVMGVETLHAPSPTGSVRENSRAIVAAAQIDELAWTVLVVASPEHAVAIAAEASEETARAARDQSYAWLGMSLLVGLMTLAGGMVLAETIRRRLSALIEGANVHASGNLNHRVPVDGDDEFGALGMALNANALRLRQNLTRLEESERRLSQLIDSMADGFVIADEEDRILFTNQRFAELVKRRPETLIGKYVEELLLPDSVERYRMETKKRLEGRPSQYEIGFCVQAGTHRRTLVSGMPLYDEEGRFCGSYGVVTDVTSRLKAQAETARSEKFRALGEMAGGVCHDFNNLLTVILGNAQYMMFDDGRNDDDVQALKIIEQAAQDGTETVRRIREFTKVRTLAVNPVPVDSNKVVTDVLDMARRRWEDDGAAQGVEFDVDFHPNAHRMVSGNDMELREALLNIIYNALDAMPQGGKLTLETFDRGEDAVGIRIEDTGTGMTEDAKEKIFDPFFTTKQTGRCSGLGLSICFGIISAHRGKIQVRSELGSGSTFTLILPAYVKADPIVPVPLPQGEETGGDDAAASPPDPRVLLVGGVPSRDKKLQEGLQSLGLYVALLESPPNALALITDPGIFNTLVVEYDLPGSRGWELARQARAARKDLPIILLADPSDDLDATQAKNAGIDEVLVRPFDPRDVHGAILTKLALHTEGVQASLAERSGNVSSRISTTGAERDDSPTETMAADATVDGGSVTETIEG